MTNMDHLLVGTRGGSRGSSILGLRTTLQRHLLGSAGELERNNGANARGQQERDATSPTQNLMTL
ncbi:hypothetical protein L195_g060487, partial [Trifolium pratense]